MFEYIYDCNKYGNTICCIKYLHYLYSSFLNYRRVKFVIRLLIFANTIIEASLSLHL